MSLVHLLAPLVAILVVMVMLWKLEGLSGHDAVRYFFLLRYQWLLSVMLCMLPWIAASGEFRKYLGNLFFPENSVHLLLITLIGFWAAVPMIAGLNLTLTSGEQRFGVRSPPWSPDDWRRKLQPWYALLVSLPLVAESWKNLARSTPSPEDMNVIAAMMPPWLAVFVGYNLASLFLWLAILLRNWWVGPAVPDLVLWHPNVVYIGWEIWKRLRGDGQHAQPAPAVAAAPYQANNVLAGYFEMINGVRHWRAGHLSAGALVFVFFWVYFAVLTLYNPLYDNWFKVSDFPPLGFLLLLIGLWGWILPAASFFLDYWRFPVPIILIFMWASCYVVTAKDHYYRVWTSEASEPKAAVADTTSSKQVAPEQADASLALEQWLNKRSGDAKESGTVFIVSSAGGGIVASAWTAQVLTAMERYLKGTFNDSLMAVSSVSGGSVGTYLYFLDFRRSGHRTISELSRVCKASTTSTLSATAWATAGVDFWRFLYSFRTDRGVVLQEAWNEAYRTAPQKLDPNSPVAADPNWPSLCSWREQVVEGDFPAVFFNATAVESGAPFLFSPIKVTPLTTSVNDQCATPPKPPFAGFGNFLDAYPGDDVAAVSAARLSATFPWITPVARAARFDNSDNATAVNPNVHLADGGYFDNFGIATLVDYIDLVAPTLKKAGVKEVVLIDIAAWKREREELLKDKNAPRSTVPRLDPLKLQVGGPLQTLFNSRGSSQATRAESEIRLLRKVLDRYQMRLCHHRYYMEDIVDPNQDFDVPLSWHLNDQQVGAIAKAADKLQISVAKLLNVQTPVQVVRTRVLKQLPATITESVAQVMEEAPNAAEEDRWNTARNLAVAAAIPESEKALAEEGVDEAAPIGPEQSVQARLNALDYLLQEKSAEQ